MTPQLCQLLGSKQILDHVDDLSMVSSRWYAKGGKQNRWPSLHMSHCFSIE